MKRLTPLILAIPLTLTGCGSSAETESAPETTVQTEWASSDEKLTVFMEHVCQRDGHDSTILPETQASSAAIHVLADENATQEDRKIALEVSLYSMGNAQEAPVPLSLTPGGPGTCEGWVWEKHLDRVYDREYADFTYAEAREVGAV